MRVLQVHNKYRSGWGGEDTVADLEAELLCRHGHDVERFSAWTRELDNAGPLRLLAAGFAAVWSPGSYSAMKRATGRYKPDLVHVHNDFPLLSPSIFWACSRAAVPVVQTLHNYRIACANALLLRGERPCEDCVGHFPWPALRHRCYGLSLSRTAALVARNVLHRSLGTYQHKVHAFIALTEFSKQVFLRAGLPANRVFVKPNFLSSPAALLLPRLPRMAFSGWMTRAKGVHLLLRAWNEIRPAGWQLLLIGDGPERAGLQRESAANPGILWCDSQPRDRVIELAAASRYAVVPSLAYENLPMAVLEALSVGTPVIAPEHGAFPGIISNNHEGLLFSPGDSTSLENALRAALAAPESVWNQWSSNARSRFLREYTSKANYTQLMAIYDQAIACFQGQRKCAADRRFRSAAASAADHVRGDS